jgi:hypothetical protein
MDTPERAIITDDSGREYQGTYHRDSERWDLILPNGQTATGVPRSAIDVRVAMYGWSISS